MFAYNSFLANTSKKVILNNMWNHIIQIGYILKYYYMLSPSDTKKKYIYIMI